VNQALAIVESVVEGQIIELISMANIANRNWYEDESLNVTFRVPKRVWRKLDTDPSKRIGFSDYNYINCGRTYSRTQ
jgi:hypothetical protein